MGTILDELLPPIEIRNVDIAKLQRFATALHEVLPHQVVVGLRGTLGAGKTRFVQAFAVSAGIDQSLVTSPTFPIVQHYHGDRLIHHIDAYRLADEVEFIELGGEELLEEDATVLIEWPDRIVRCLPVDRITLDLQIDASEADKRTVQIHCRDLTLRSRLKDVAESMAADSGH